MAKRRVRKVNPQDAHHFQMLGFRDYEAARRLLLSDMLLPGATLASTALEKYLKCILATKGVRISLHLDRVDEFKRLFVQHGIAIFQDLDPVFLETLSKAYQLRYYDTVSKVVFGFLKWQLLGELDATIALLEERITMRNSEGEPVKSSYQQAIENRTATICEENYLVNGIDKKDFLERKGPALMMRVDDSYGEIMAQAKELGAESYKGNIISLVDVKIDGK